MKHYILISLLFTLNLIKLNAQYPFAGGSGSEADPYQISTLEQLDSIHNYLDKYYILLNDLDFAGSAYDSKNSAEGWLPIGDYTNNFTGSFNGADHVIKNLYINRPASNYIGLFGYTNAGSAISSLGIVNCIIYGKDCVGSLVGNNYSTINNCHATGSVSGEKKIGGLVGLSSSAITNCYATGSVSGNYCAGGLVGENYSTISNCYAMGSISGIVGCFGGLVGYNHSNIINCYATGSISGDGGGLVGENFGITNSSYWNKDSTSTGILINIGIITNVTGKTTAEMKLQETYENWDFTNTWVIVSTYNKGYPFFRYKANVPGELFTGGAGTEDDPYQISTIEHLNNVRCFLDKHFILINDLDFAGSAYDRKNSTEGWLPIGSDVNPFTGVLHGTGHVIRNLYINRPSTDYIGLFGYIYNATIDSLGVAGATIKGNVATGILAGYVKSYVFTIYNSSCFSLQIRNCYVTGNITCNSNGGGLIGYVDVVVLSIDSYCNLQIENCYAAANVTCNSNGGGIFGYVYIRAHYGVIDIYGLQIENCYTAANVTCNSNGGGLIGYSDAGSLSDQPQFAPLLPVCRYNNCLLIENCIWDINTTGMTGAIGKRVINTSGFDSSNVTGLTTSQMKDSVNFRNWDFESTWTIRSDSTYPALRSINNAPFAFRDSVATDDTINLTDLLVNDFDIETIQNSLVLIVDTIYGKGSMDASNRYYFPADSAYGYTDSLVYRVGEKLEQGDTLWGCTAIAVLTKSNIAPAIISKAPAIVNEGEEYTYTVIATDNDILTYNLSNGPEGMEIKGNVITWLPDGYSSASGKIILTVSDGFLSDTENFSIAVLPADISLNEIQTATGKCNSKNIEIDYHIASGSPTEYQLIYNDNAQTAGFVNMGYVSRDSKDSSGIISFAIPDSTIFGTYSAKLQMQNNSKVSMEYPFTFTLNIPANYLHKKYDGDVVFIDNSAGQFVSYQWFDSSGIISDATKQFYYNANGLNGSYYAQVLTTSGGVLQTCPLIIDNDMIKSGPAIFIYPNPVKQGKDFTLKITGINDHDLKKATATIYNQEGNEVHKTAFTGNQNILSIDRHEGIYFILLTTTGGIKLTYSLIVIK